MNYDIRTNANPTVNIIPDIDHKKENWKSPLMDKFNRASEYISSIDSVANFECFFDSSEQIFTPEYERCSGMSKEEIYDLIKTINNL